MYDDKTAKRTYTTINGVMIIVKRIKKPNRILNPCLFFQSPTYIKKRLGLERRNSFYEETKELLSKSCRTLDKEKRASSAISQRGKKRI